MTLALAVFAMVGAGIWQLLDTHARAVDLARANNLALYVLESVGNRIRADASVGPVVTGRLRQFVADVQLPPGYTLDATQPPDRHDIVVVTLTCRVRDGAFREYRREVAVR